uniref:Uncharacterized protein n=1 Tax=Rhodnius prolixus TaxID=13249 RepID=T1HVS1_RHOPR
MSRTASLLTGHMLLIIAGTTCMLLTIDVPSTRYSKTSSTLLHLLKKLLSSDTAVELMWHVLLKQLRHPQQLCGLMHGSLGCSVFTIAKLYCQ